MKKSLIKWLLSLCVLCILSFPSFAKKGDKVPGYVILNNGQKITGKVIIGSITDNEVKVKFIHPGKSKKTVYRPKEVKGYGYQEVEIDEIGDKVTRWVNFSRHKVDYPPKPFASTLVFMEKEEMGAMTLYCYYVEVRNDVKNPYKYYYYLQVDGGKVQKVTRESFKSISKTLFKKYPALANRIGQKDFVYRNLDRMVRDFNYWVVNQHDGNEYRVALKED